MFQNRAGKPIWAGEEPVLRLRAEPWGAGMLLSWTTHEEGFTLESAPSLLGAPWTPVESVTTTDFSYEALLPTTEAQQFFRLRQE